MLTDKNGRQIGSTNKKLQTNGFVIHTETRNKNLNTGYTWRNSHNAWMEQN